MMSLSVPNPTVAPQDPTIVLQDQTFVFQDQTQIPDQAFILPDQAKLQDLTFALQKNQKISSHQQINTQDTNQKPKPQSQKDMDQVQTSNEPKSKTRFLIAGIIIFVIAAAIGLAIGLSYRYKASIKAVGPPTKINFDDGRSFVMNQYLLQKINFMETDTKLNMLISANVAAEQKNVTRRALQQQKSNNNEYNVTVHMPQQGLELVLSSDDKLGIFIEPATFIKSLSQDSSDEHNQTRVLTDANQTDKINQSAVYSEIQKQMSTILNDKLSSKGSFQFKELSMIELKLDEKTGNFDLVMENKSDSNSVRRLWRPKRIIKKAIKMVNNVVIPAVQAIKKNDQLIKTASGALIGVVGNNFLIQGKGTAAGITAQTFMKYCMPLNKIIMQCNIQSISTALADAATSKDQVKIFFGRPVVVKPGQKRPLIKTKLGGTGILKGVRK